MKTLRAAFMEALWALLGPQILILQISYLLIPTTDRKRWTEK